MNVNMAVKFQTVLFATCLSFLTSKGVHSIENCVNTPTSSDITCVGLDALPPSGELFVDPETVTTVTIRDSPTISEIPDNYFNDLPKLTTIALSNNGLISLRLTSFKFLPELTSVTLTNNPVVCDASIDWLRTWRDARESNRVMGQCNDGTDINEYLDTLPESEPVRVKFVQDSYIISENVGNTHINIEREGGDLESSLPAKVVTEMRGITEEEFRILNKELAFKAQYFQATIDISVEDDEVVNMEERSLDMFLVPGPLTAIGSKASIRVEDNDVSASTPSSKTSAPGEGDDDDDSKGGGSVVVIIIIIIILIVVCGGLVGVFLWKKNGERKVKAHSGPQASYSAVKGDAENKVYNETTEQIA